MSEKTRKNNDREDELNQSRFFAERGAEVINTEEPGGDGIEIDEEDIAETKSRGREQPFTKEESETAEKSPFYGQGFPGTNDKGIRRDAEPNDDSADAEIGEAS
ncbi:MAG TPA: hypothetical protein VGM92_15690 [Candidatus Kapabacteria bacterium]